jgi:site-specific recombinase XerC
MPTVYQACQEYLDILAACGKSPRTLYTYGKDLEQLTAFFGAETPLEKITLAWMGKFLRSPELLMIPTSGKQRSARTIAKTQRVARQFILWTMEVGYMDHNPLPKALQKKPQPEAICALIAGA